MLRLWHSSSRGIYWLAAVLLLWAGCGYSQGELLYFLGVGQAKLAKAQFKLSQEPVAILVDDPQGIVQPPPARQELADLLGEELIRRSAAQKVIPRRTIDNMRLSDPKFSRYSAREVGELAGASQMILLTVSDYRASDTFDDPSNAAAFEVHAKVLNVLEKKRRSRVRLWPQSPAGRVVRVQLGGAEVARLKQPDAIGRALAKKLAGDIAKFFYDHRLNDFGS